MPTRPLACWRQDGKGSEGGGVGKDDTFLTLRHTCQAPASDGVLCRRGACISGCWCHVYAVATPWRRRESCLCKFFDFCCFLFCFCFPAAKTDPVVDRDGHSYERGAILTWLAQRKESPMTHRPMWSEDLVPNRGLREAIEAFVRGSRARTRGATVSEGRAAMLSLGDQAAVALVAASYGLPGHPHAPGGSASDVVTKLRRLVVGRGDGCLHIPSGTVGGRENRPTWPIALCSPVCYSHGLWLLQTLLSIPCSGTRYLESGRSYTLRFELV